MKQYKYDAFISYRHTDLDKFAAENLHKKLEAFRLPRNLSKKKTEGRTRISRVFRDKDELPLTSNLEDPITRALAESEYLIVICSPRLRESLWCKKEIETFIGMHGREKVLAVLIEGEPAESFPDELLYFEETVQEADGTMHKVRKEMEPLAADIRGKSRKAMKRAMNTEILRLLAPMFSVSFDDLRQRHRERRLKRILAASLVGTAVCLGVGTVSTAMALRIHNQKKQIEQQTAEIVAQNEEISRQNDALLENQAIRLSEDALRLLNEGDREGAIRTAVSALTEYDGIKLPYTCEAQYALTKSLQVYDNAGVIKPQYQLVAEGFIDFMKLSPDREKLLTADESGTIILWNIADGTVLKKCTDCDTLALSEDMVTFLGDTRFVYKNGSDKVSVYDMEADSTYFIDIMDSFIYGLYGDKAGENLFVQTKEQLLVFSAKDGTQTAVYEAAPQRQLGRDVFVDEKTGVCGFTEESLEGDRETFVFYNYKENKVLFTLPIEGFSVETVKFEDHCAYILANHFSEENLADISSMAAACDFYAGKLKWQTQFSDGMGRKLFLPGYEEAENLLVATSYETKLLSLADGSVTERFPLGETVVGGGAYINADSFIFFTRNGIYHYLSVGNLTDYQMDMKFDCPFTNVADFQVAADEFLVLPYQSERITVFDYSNRDAMTESIEPVPLPSDDYLETPEVWNLMEEKGLPKKDYAEYAFYNEDKTLLFITYRDDTFAIYDADSMEKKAEFSDIPSRFCYCFGTDENGNLFVGGISEAYMLSPDFKLLAQIEGMIALDAEDNCVIVDNTFEEQYRIPIYSTDELIAEGCKI